MWHFTLSTKGGCWEETGEKLLSGLVTGMHILSPNIFRRNTFSLHPREDKFVVLFHFSKSCHCFLVFVLDQVTSLLLLHSKMYTFQCIFLMYTFLYMFNLPCRFSPLTQLFCVACFNYMNYKLFTFYIVYIVCHVHCFFQKLHKLKNM